MKQNQDTADGPVELHLHYVEMSGSVAFIGVGDMKEKKNDAPVKTILEGAKAASLRARKATSSQKSKSLCRATPESNMRPRARPFISAPGFFL